VTSRGRRWPYFVGHCGTKARTFSRAVEFAGVRAPSASTRGRTKRESYKGTSIKGKENSRTKVIQVDWGLARGCQEQLTFMMRARSRSSFFRLGGGIEAICATDEKQGPYRP